MLLWLMNAFCPMLCFNLAFQAACRKQKATQILTDKFDPKKNTLSLQRQYPFSKRLGSLPKIWSIRAGLNFNRTLVLQFCFWPSKLSLKLVWRCMLILILKLPSKSNTATKASNFTSRGMVLPKWRCISVRVWKVGGTCRCSGYRFSVKIPKPGWKLCNKFQNRFQFSWLLSQFWVLFWGNLPSQAFSAISLRKLKL